MNDAQLEAWLLAARPYEPGQYSQLTQSVMDQVRQRATFNRQLRGTSNRSKQHVYLKLRSLHGAGLIVALLAVIVLLGGVAYASLQFLPDMIKILHRKTNMIGRVEYSVPAFADCYKDGRPKVDAFEVRPDVHLSDEDVEKTLRAKCELLGMDTFARDMWPTYGEHQPWREGDKIFYARPDFLGRVKQTSNHSLTLDDNGAQATYTSLDGQPLKAFSHGKEINIHDIQPGDLVFAIAQVTETHHSRPDTHTPDPKVRGLLAVVKMSLPERYYRQMQSYIQPVQACLGNPAERCSDGPMGGSAIDIFPREGGEGARNPDLRKETPTLVSREIAGTISSITADRFTLRASSGTTYTIHIDKGLIDTYNSVYAPNYEQWAPSDPAKVRAQVGSWVSVLYMQEPQENPTEIAKPDITQIMLRTSLSAKK